MARVLIVDDEENIRRGLRSILEQAELGITAIHECADGQEAYAYLQKEPADLIIADIRMPHLDGLQLTRKLREELHSLSPVIFLSGHDDFEYAVRAIQFQASAYLLKPVDIAELIGAVRTALQKIHPARLLYDVCAAKMQGLLTGAEPEGWQYFQQFGLFRQLYTVTIAKLPPGDAHRILRRYQTHMHPSFTFMPLRHTADRLLCLSAEPSGLPDELLRSERLSVSGVHQSAAELPLALREAVETEEYHCILPDKRLCHTDLAGRTRPAPPHETIQTLKQLSALTPREICGTVDALFHPDLTKTAEIRYFHDTERLIHDSILSQYDMFSLGSASIRHMGLDAYREKLKEQLCRLNGILTGSADESGAGRKHAAINQAIAFIHENFGKDINMAVVANHVSLNYYYFSDMFKKQTGQSFVDYLKVLRVSRAKELLQNKSAKISWVSLQCGYEDSRQFSRVFKELTGVTPKDFRRTLQTALQPTPGS